MQEIHATVGGGRVPGIAVAGGGGDRRIRAHQQSQHHIQALKCPRCESLNTKFCYYNNYNLSQPRHFCKNCRRYWTKGGVLRNVPVGGGSRKPKRSSKTKKPPLSTAAAAAAEPSGNSSSDGSSVTASNPAAVTAVADPASENLSVPVKGGSDSKLYGNRVEWPEMMGQVSPEDEMIPEVSGLTRVVATSSEEMTRFGFDGNSVNQQCLDGNQKTEIQLDDRTAGVDFTGRPSDLSGGFGALDWGGGIGDQGLFDLTCTVDHAYWSQNQWSTDFLP